MPTHTSTRTNNQAVGVSADLEALTDHVGRLAALVTSSMSIGNEQANITLAIIGTIFLPLTFIAGRSCEWLHGCFVVCG